MNVKFIKEIIQRVTLKHLRGQHDQMRHGWRGVSGIDDYRTPGAKNKPKKATPAVPDKKPRGRPKGSTVKPPTAKVAVAPTKKGSGTPVSAALDVMGKLKKDDEVNYAISLIDKVHSDGGLSKIPVKVTTSAARMGGFMHQIRRTPRGHEPSAPVKIMIDAEHESRMDTTIHEIGHFLDYQGIATAVGAWRGFGYLEKTTPLNEFLAGYETKRDKLLTLLDKIENSKLAKTIVTARYNSRDYAYKVDGREVLPSSRMLNYLGNRQELFARSYVQYIVRKTQDKRLSDSMQLHMKNMPEYAQFQYHKKEDFGEIEKAFDDLFTELGWI